MLRALLLIAVAVATAAAQDRVLIRNGLIADGSGADPVVGDVEIRGDTVVRVGQAVAAPDGSVRAIDATGLVVAPGFIDIHSHGRRNLLRHPEAENYVRQGVTTILEGQDGGSPLPLGPFLQRLEDGRIGVNIGLLVGQGSIRAKVIGLEDREATPTEIREMKALVRQAMLDGAFGISTGLFYIPGAYTPVEEVIELAKVVGEHGGFHCSHMRDEADGIAESVRECIRIGEEGGLPTQLTHHKIVGKENWGRSRETLALVDAARRRGVDVTIDQYPYTASSTSTAALFPQWAQEGGQDGLLRRLRSPEEQARIKDDVIRRLEFDRGGGHPRNVLLAACGFDSSLNGQNLAQVTEARGREVTFANAADTLIEIQRAGGCSAVFHAMAEEDVRRIMSHPHTMVASDGGIPTFGLGVPHPRNYGTFARVLGRYSREQKLFPLEEAVRKMTSLPASRMGLTARGLLRAGMKADIVIFDRESIIDRAEFLKPHRYATGVRHVLLNGQIVLLDGELQRDVLSGRVLYGPGKQ